MTAAYYKGAATWRDTQGKFGKFSAAEAVCLFWAESGHITFLELSCVHQPWSSTELQYLKHLLEFHYIGMLQWITGHVTQLELQVPSSPWKLADQADIVRGQIMQGPEAI